MKDMNCNLIAFL